MGAKNSKENVTLARSPRWQALVNGDLNIEDLDDEEILTGRLKDASGRLMPKSSGMIPRPMYEALTRELVSRMQGKFREQVAEAIEVLVDIMYNGQTKDMVRYQAATYVIERVMGKIETKSTVTVEATPWQAAVESGELFVDLEDPPIVDVEVVNDLPTPARTRTRAPVRRRRPDSEEPR